MLRINLILFVALLIASCNKTEENATPCQEPVICTLHIETIPVQIQYLSNDLKTLVTETILQSTKEVLRTDTLFSNYKTTVADDMHLSQLAYEGSPIVFKIYENGQLMSSVDYLIGHD